MHISKQKKHILDESLKRVEKKFKGKLWVMGGA